MFPNGTIPLKSLNKIPVRLLQYSAAMNNPHIAHWVGAITFSSALLLISTPQLQAQIGGGSETLFEFHGAASGDYLGRAVAGGGDVNGDGVPDIIVGAPQSVYARYYQQGMVYVFSGLDGAMLHQWDGPSADHNLFGAVVSNAGDVNADGFDDVIIGATHASPNGISHAGSALVYSGADGSLLYQWDGTSQYETLGDSVSGAGDVNGDGFDDLIIGAPEANAGNLNNAGSAFVYSGADGSLLYRFDGTESNFYFARCTAGVGDINNDGFDDVIVSGKSSAPGSPYDIYSAFVYSGADGTVIYQFDGETSSYLFGHSLSSAGDVNADGTLDIIIGSPQGGPSHQGATFVYSGADGTLLHRWLGEDYGPLIGGSVADAGDVNGDGFDDLLITTLSLFYSSSGSSGEVIIFSGADGSLLHTWSSTRNNDNFGISIAGAGDLNMDGFADVIVGASQLGTSNYSTDGTASVFSFKPYLYSTAWNISATSGGTVQLDFDFPDAAGLHQYKLLVSASGMGSTFYGIEIPLILDNMLGRTFLGNYPVSVYSNLHGTLDAFGDASGSITLPAGMSSSMIGATYHFAAITNPAGQLPEYCSIALPLTITL